MATATLTNGPTITTPGMHGWAIRFDGEGWDVLDLDGDAMDWQSTRDGAIETAEDMGRSARLDALRDELNDATAECEDLARMEKALAILAGE